MTKLEINFPRFDGKLIEFYQKLKYLEFLKIKCFDEDFWPLAKFTHFPPNIEVKSSNGEIINSLKNLAERSCPLASLNVDGCKIPANIIQQFLQVRV